MAHIKCHEFKWRIFQTVEAFRREACSVLTRCLSLAFASRLSIASIFAGCTLCCSLMATDLMAQGAPYMFDLPKLHPATHRAWVQSLPDQLGRLPEWLTIFKGVASPIRDVSVNGVSMKFGTSCMPHNCGSIIAGVLFSPQRNRIAGLVRLGGAGPGSSLMIVGSMSSTEFSCIQRLIDDHQSNLC